MGAKDKKKGLGRGLDALLGTPSGSVARPQAKGITVKMCPVEQIVPHAGQPRKVFDEVGLHELAQSIKEEGILQPLLVREVSGGKFEIIVGERRFRAAKIAGLDKVPVIVKSLSDESAFKAALIENLQREDLNPMEVAFALKKIQEEEGLTQEELALAVGKDRSHVANHLRLLGLSPVVKEMLESGELSFGHGRAIAGLKSFALQEQAAKMAVEKQLSVRQTEDLVSKLKKGAKPSKPDKKEEPNQSALMVEEQLRLKFGSRVRLKYDPKKQKGEIKLPFSSIDELDALLRLLGIDTEEF